MSSVASNMPNPNLHGPNLHDQEDFTTTKGKQKEQVELQERPTPEVNLAAKAAARMAMQRQQQVKKAVEAPLQELQTPPPVIRSIKPLTHIVNQSPAESTATEETAPTVTRSNKPAKYTRVATDALPPPPKPLPPKPIRPPGQEINYNRQISNESSVSGSSIKSETSHSPLHSFMQDGESFPRTPRSPHPETSRSSQSSSGKELSAEQIKLKEQTVAVLETLYTQMNSYNKLIALAETIMDPGIKAKHLDYAQGALKELKTAQKELQRLEGKIEDIRDIQPDLARQMGDFKKFLDVCLWIAEMNETPPSKQDLKEKGLSYVEMQIKEYASGFKSSREISSMTTEQKDRYLMATNSSFACLIGLNGILKKAQTQKNVVGRESMVNDIQESREELNKIIFAKENRLDKVIDDYELRHIQDSDLLRKIVGGHTSAFDGAYIFRSPGSLDLLRNVNALLVKLPEFREKNVEEKDKQVAQYTVLQECIEDLHKAISLNLREECFSKNIGAGHTPVPEAFNEDEKKQLKDLRAALGNIETKVNSISEEAPALLTASRSFLVTTISKLLRETGEITAQWDKALKDAEAQKTVNQSLIDMAKAQPNKEGLLKDIRAAHMKSSNLMEKLAEGELKTKLSEQSLLLSNLFAEGKKPKGIEALIKKQGQTKPQKEPFIATKADTPVNIDASVNEDDIGKEVKPLKLKTKKG